jgi:polyhydroxybutyrate depolymerase
MIARRARRWPGSSGWLGATGASLLAGLTLVGCKASDTGPQTGSESHFLEHCSQTCADGLSCLYGACTKMCSGAAECGALEANAKCVPTLLQPKGDAGIHPQGATCDLSCTVSDECAGLGAGYQCELGFCRKGTSSCPAPILQPGNTTRQVVVGDRVRSYILHVPASYTGTTSVPLVLDFHPMGLGLEWEKDNSGFQAISDQRGFLLAWPQGLETAWNIGPCCTTARDIDDFGFARAVVRQIFNDACVDPARVHAVGFSMGGAMAYYLGCTASEVFASVAVSSMDLFVESEAACKPSRPVAEISFRDTLDTVVPYGGGPSMPPGRPDLTSNLLGAVGTFQRWAEIDGCTSPPIATDAGRGCSSYSTCQAGVEVTLCTSDKGGQVVGDAQVAWDMLARHPMP